ncbi:MAG: hypothetical protein ACYSUI_05635 [Planctomycetota bacterium]|jgi:hypothetical protein
MMRVLDQHSPQWVHCGDGPAGLSTPATAIRTALTGPVVDWSGQVCDTGHQLVARVVGGDADALRELLLQ